MSTLFIKNMVCNRCILVVEQTIRRMGWGVDAISLGEVTLDRELKETERALLGEELNKFGFELIGTRQGRIIEQIKTIIIDLVHHQEGGTKHNLSEIISGKLNADYSYLSNLFSKVEGITIEKYFIAQRIEKVKELLVYGELTLSEIADRLDYSSVAYLSNQFKKWTGLTPTHFKKIGEEKRKPLDEV